MATRPEIADPAVDELKRRARRRLVGAIVLALAAAVVLPMLLESNPKPLGNDVSIQIPPIDQGKFVTPLSPDKGMEVKAQSESQAASPAASGDATASASQRTLAATEQPDRQQVQKIDQETGEGDGQVKRIAAPLENLKTDERSEGSGHRPGQSDLRVDVGRPGLILERDRPSIVLNHEYNRQPSLWTVPFKINGYATILPEYSARTRAGQNVRYRIKSSSGRCFINNKRS